MDTLHMQMMRLRFNQLLLSVEESFDVARRNGSSRASS